MKMGDLIDLWITNPDSVKGKFVAKLSVSKFGESLLSSNIIIGTKINGKYIINLNIGTGTGKKTLYHRTQLVKALNYFLGKGKYATVTTERDLIEYKVTEQHYGGKYVKIECDWVTCKFNSGTKHCYKDSIKLIHKTDSNEEDSLLECSNYEYDKLWVKRHENSSNYEFDR